jgi:hypothetical protein
VPDTLLRPATWQDVKKLAVPLNNAGVEYALVVMPSRHTDSTGFPKI